MPNYIVPTSVNQYNAERLAAAALVISSEYWSDYRENLMKSRHKLETVALAPWDVCESTGHQSQSFVPMDAAPGKYCAKTNTTNSKWVIRYTEVILDCVVEFCTFDSTCDYSDGFFNVFTTFRDGRSDIESVPASHCMDLVCEWDEAEAEAEAALAY